MEGPRLAGGPCVTEPLYNRSQVCVSVQSVCLSMSGDRYVLLTHREIYSHYIQDQSEGKGCVQD